MTDEIIDTSYRNDRMVEERLRSVLVLAAIMLFSIGLAVALNTANIVTVLGTSAGIALFIAAFLKPELALLAVTAAAPIVVALQTTGANKGLGENSPLFTSIIPGTGITPLNGMMILLVLGTWAHRFSTRAPAAEGTEVDRPLLLFLAWSALSMVVATALWDFDEKGMGEWMQFAAGYSTFWVVRRRWYSHRLAKVAVWLVLGLLVYQSWVIYGQWKLVDEGQFAWELKKKITGTFPPGNSNDVGTYLSCYGLVALGLFMGMKKSPLRYVALAVFVAAASACFMTYSRGAQFGLIVGGLGMALYAQKRYLIPLLVVLAVLPGILPSSMADRFLNTSDDSAVSRKEVWKRAIVVTLKNPLVGVGWRGYNKQQDYAGYELRDPHNMYLLVSAEQGLPGLALFLLILGGSATIITRTLKRKYPPFTMGLAIGLFGALVCFAVNNAFGSRMLYMYVIQHFFLLLGLLVILTQAPPGEDVPALIADEADPEPVGAGRTSPWRYRSYV